MKYDAFISYRHTPLDMEFAKKVHAGLETFRVPKAVRQKTGKNRIRRVFRDQEELPIGSDLNDNISAALKESEYLIVICSPETPGSYWVAKEIETFIQLHDRHHVLAVLVDGEPAQSFPPQLLTDEQGNPVEPLAADVRGATPKERNKRFKTELLRLAAPILGCNYDDLRQRHRERIMKRNVTIAAVIAGVVAGLGVSFGIYNASMAARMRKLADEKAQLAEEKTVLADDKTRLADEKSKLAEEKSQLASEVLAEYRQKQVNQSRFYAEESMTLLHNGNREDAVIVAAAGLPATADDERPVVAEARFALANALRMYDVGTELKYDRLLTHDLTVRDMTLSHDARYLTSVDDAGTVYVWECESWKMLAKIAPIDADNSRVRVVAAIADDKGVVIVSDKEAVRYSFDGAEIARTSLGKTVTKCDFSDKYDLAVARNGHELCFFSLSDLSMRKLIENADDETFGSAAAFSRDGRFFAVSNMDAQWVKPAHIMIVDLSDFHTVSAEASLPYILDMTITDSGNLMAVSTNEDFYKGVKSMVLESFAAGSGESIYQRDIPVEVRNLGRFDLLIDSQTYNGKTYVVVVVDSDFFAYNETTGTPVSHVPLAEMALTLTLIKDSTTAFVGYENGDIVAIDTEEGRLYSGSTITTDAAMVDMRVFNGGIVLSMTRSNELLVMTYHVGSGVHEVSGLPTSVRGIGAAPDGSYFAVCDRGETRTIYILDPDGNVLYTTKEENYPNVTGFHGNEFVMADYHCVSIIAPNGAQEPVVRKLVFADLGLASSYLKASLSDNGRFLVLWGTSGIAVLDLEEQSVLYNEKTYNVGAAVIDRFGRNLAVSQFGNPLRVVNLQSGEVTEFIDADFTQTRDSNGLKYLAMDPDGKLVAMACADGFVRVKSLTSLETLLEVPLQVRAVCFLAFTQDSKHFIMEGDDYRVQFYSLVDGSCVNSFDVPLAVSYIAEGKDEIAFCDNFTVTLASKPDFGRLAYVDNALVFDSAHGVFMASEGKRLWRIEQPSLEQLRTEVEKQFPGASLSNEKKVKYNVE
ncbi:MAG: TIR domain-containing protein [Lachnospiraceae bacterium]|nr:TIR domain-containing protein [Lachnospiraceae bacterium]